MNKFVNILRYFGSIAMTIALSCACSKYNYPNIFPFDEAFYERANKINGINGYEAFMPNIEFEKMKVTLKKYGFVDWKELGDLSFYSQDKAVNRTFLGIPHGGMFSKNESSGLDGEFPVILYFPDIGKVVILIVDGMM